MRVNKNSRRNILRRYSPDWIASKSQDFSTSQSAQTATQTVGVAVGHSTHDACLVPADDSIALSQAS